MQAPIGEAPAGRRARRILPWAAVIAAALFIGVFAWETGRRAEMLVESDETRAAAEAAVARLQAVAPSAIDDPGLLDAAAAVARGRHIVNVWLVDSGGEVIYSSGGLAQPGDDVARLATAETRRVLSEVPAGDLADGRRLRLLVASALGAEGEHNDVFRHIVRVVVGRDGTPSGVAGVTYEVNVSLSQVGAGTVALTLLLWLSFLAYWFALPAWVYLDARHLGQRAVAWTAFTLIANLVGLLAYLLARPPHRQGRAG